MQGIPDANVAAREAGRLLGEVDGSNRPLYRQVIVEMELASTDSHRPDRGHA